MATFPGTVSHSRSTGAVASHSLSHTVESGTDVLLVFVYAWIDSGAYTLDVDWGANGLTQRAQRVTSTAFHAELWELVNPTPGTANIVMTPSVSAHCYAIGVNVAGVQTPTYYRSAVPTGLVSGNESGVVVTSEDGDTGLEYGGWSRPINGPTTTANNTTHAGTIGAVSVLANDEGGGSNGGNQSVLMTFPFTGGPTTDLRTQSTLFRAGGVISLAFLDSAPPAGAPLPVIVHHLRQQGIS